MSGILEVLDQCAGLSPTGASRGPRVVGGYVSSTAELDVDGWPRGGAGRVVQSCDSRGPA